MIIYQNDVFVPFIYTLSLLIVAFFVFWFNFDKYRKLIMYENKRVNLAIGITLALFSLLVYIFTIYFLIQDNNDYWVLHSYCWHVPIMMSSMFILEAFIVESNHVSFTFYIVDRIRCYRGERIRQYTSVNNLGIELTVIEIEEGREISKIEEINRDIEDYFVSD